MRRDRLTAVRTGASLWISLLGLLAACEQPVPPTAPPPVELEPGAPRTGQVIPDPSNPAWFRYSGGGAHFLAGAGDPEDFLYRGERQPDGTRTGDQLEIIEKLCGTGVNGIYFQTIRSHGGDGDPTHNPFIGNDPSNSLNFAVLDQWETWFDALEELGVVIYLFFYDDAAIVWDTGDLVSVPERHYFEAIVNRFEHHANLVWIIAEEYQERLSPTRVSRLAAIIRAADNYNHPIGVHKLSGLSFEEFADDPNIDQFTIQYNEADPAVLHEGMVEAWTMAAGRYNLNMSESRFHGTGADARRRHWAIAMGGAYVMVLSMDIINTPLSDLEDLGRLAGFMESTGFQEMAPMDELAGAATLYVLANPGRSYIAYGNGLSAGNALGLRNLSSGNYALRWFDPVDGRETLDQIEIPGGDYEFRLPDGWAGEAALHVQRTDAADGARLTARNFRIVASAGTAVDIELSAPGTDAGNLEYQIVRPPASGSISGSGSIRRYSPAPGFIGEDEFLYTITGDNRESRPGRVSIVVRSAEANSPPRIANTRFTVEAGAAHTVSLTFDDPDGPGPYAFEIVVQPEHGELTGSGNDITYTPDPSYTGTDRFVWRVSDSIDTSNAATVEITVLGPNSAN